MSKAGVRGDIRVLAKFVLILALKLIMYGKELLNKCRNVINAGT